MLPATAESIFLYNFILKSQKSKIFQGVLKQIVPQMVVFCPSVFKVYKRYKTQFTVSFCKK